MKPSPLFGLTQRQASKVAVINLGFSLTELLVVIAVIAILTALLLAVLSKAKARAQRIQCVANLDQIGVGLQNCLANNRGYPNEVEWVSQIQVNGFGVSHPEDVFGAKKGRVALPVRSLQQRFSGHAILVQW